MPSSALIFTQTHTYAGLHTYIWHAISCYASPSSVILLDCSGRKSECSKAIQQGPILQNKFNMPPLYLLTYHFIFFQ